MLNIIINAPVPFILNNLYITSLRSVPSNLGKPKSISIFPITKNGNKDGNILFSHILNENLTDSKTSALSINTSTLINIIIKRSKTFDNIFFIITHFLIY